MSRIAALSLSSLLAGLTHAVQTQPIVQAQLFENVGVRSYVYGASLEQPVDDVWGVGVDWREGSLSTSLDLTLLSADDAEDPDGGTGVQQLLHLNIGHHGKRLSFGTRYYSATDGYAHSALGQQLLSQKGALGAGDGSEVWARWRLGKLDITPRVRRTLQPQDGRLRAGDQYILAAEHPLAGDTRLRLDVARQHQDWVDEPDAPRLDQSRFGLQVRNARWQFTVNRIERVQIPRGQPAAHRVRSATHNVAAALQLGEHWSLRPMLSVTSGANEARTQARLVLDVVTPRLPVDRVKLNLNRQDQENLMIRSSVSEVRLSGSRKLRWEGAFGPVTLLSGCLLYRHRDDGFGEAAPGEVGLQLTLTHSFDA